MKSATALTLGAHTTQLLRPGLTFMAAIRKLAATDFLQVLLEYLINERGCANLMMFPEFPVHSCMVHDSKQSSQANLFMPIAWSDQRI